MHVIVPLAGPDFEGPDGRVKSLRLIEGSPFLLSVLCSRPWASCLTSSAYIFILKDSQTSRIFVKSHLLNWFPHAKIVYVSDYAQGAALSALGACSLLPISDEPVIIDLADIFYKATFLSPVEIFKRNTSCKCIVPTFESSSPIYSYLRFSEDGRIFLGAAEKRVISCFATAGTYIFRNQATYISALGNILEKPGNHLNNKNLFVCPVLNGLVRIPGSVMSVKVNSLYDPKTI